MNFRKMFRYAFPFVFIMSAVSLPAAAATLPISVKGFKCGSEDAVINWITSSTGPIDISANGILGKYAPVAEAHSVQGLEAAGIVALPQSGVVGFRKLSAFVRIMSQIRESEKHSVVQFRFRLSDNSLYVPTKRLSDLGVDGSSNYFQQITVLANAFDKDVSSATLENVALYVLAGGNEGVKNLLMFGDLTIESQNDVFRPDTIDLHNVAGCEAIGGSIPGGGLGGGNGGNGGNAGNRIRQRLLQLKHQLKQRQDNR